MTISRHHPLPIAIVIVAIVLLVGGCSSDDTEQVASTSPDTVAVVEDPAQLTTTTASTTTASTTTTTAAIDEEIEPADDILDPAFLAETLDGISIPDDSGSFLFAVFDADGEVHDASTGADADGVAPTATDPFRIGSITKIFTALATMQLVEEGLVDLDAPAADYVSRFAVPDDVTVRHLLSHRSGIYNVTDVGSFFGEVFDEPGRKWTAEDQVELVADREPVFEPGAQFGYSNTNYVILGVLLEEVTGGTYGEAIRVRILDPLQLESTYLPGEEEGPPPFDPFTGPGGDDPDYDYTSINTAAWSAGALVSSGADLHDLFTSLYDGQIVSDATLEQMTTGDDYGLGLELWEKSEGLVGHSGGIPGYFTMVRHDVDSGITAFLASTADVNPGPAIDPMLEALSAAA